MRINESIKMIDMLRERREHLRNEGENGLRASESWCVYSADRALNADTVLLIAEPAGRNPETGEVILPQRARDMGYSLAATAETVDQTVIHAVNQDSDVSPEALADALIHYLETGEYPAS